MSFSDSGDTRVCRRASVAGRTSFRLILCFPVHTGDFGLPNGLFNSNFKEQNVEFIDLLDELGRASKQAVLYKPNNTHWNIAGNRLAADVIARELFHVPSPAVYSNLERLSSTSALVRFC
jgi:hypothetical protein